MQFCWTCQRHHSVSAKMRFNVAWSKGLGWVTVQHFCDITELLYLLQLFSNSLAGVLCTISSV